MAHDLSIMREERDERCAAATNVYLVLRKSLEI